MATATCQYCKNLLGCPLLVGDHGYFDADRLLLQETDRGCSRFEEIEGARERSVRDWGYSHLGVGYFRALYSLPEIAMDDLRQGERDELMYENMPDFQHPTLLWEGMTTTQRKELLRWQTDENGSIVVEVDNERVEHQLARPEYHIKSYACSPDGPIKVDKAVAWAWNIEQVIDHVLKREVELGLIVKAKKSEAEQSTESEASMPGPNQGTRVIRKTTSAAPAAQAAPASTTRKVSPKPPSPAPAAVAKAPTPQPVTRPVQAVPAGRVAAPPRRIVPGASQAAPAARQAAPAASAAAPASHGGGAGISIDLLETHIHKVVAPLIANLEAQIEKILEQQQAGYEGFMDAITIMHDIAGQTGGTYQVPRIDKQTGNYLMKQDGTYQMESPHLFSHPSKLRAYIEGTAYDPENMELVDPDEVVGSEVVEESPAEEPVEGEA
jgi:hypothetical protein